MKKTGVFSTVLGLGVIGGCAVTGTFLVAGLAFRIGLGLLDTFRVLANGGSVRQAAQVALGFPSQPNDAPVNARLDLDADNIQARPLPVPGGKINAQLISGSATIEVLVASIAEDDPCNHGVFAGTFTFTFNDSGVDLEQDDFRLPPAALDIVLRGSFTICLEVSATIDADITITEIGCTFGPVEEPDGSCLTDLDCPFGTVCDDGLCGAVLAPECVVDDDCGAAEQCQNGSCVPVIPSPSGCTTNADCLGGEICQTGVCVPVPSTCSTNADCMGGEICQSGVCVPVPTGCSTNADCAGGEICQSGTCVPVPSGCSTNADCSGGQVCQSGSCVPAPTGCSTNADCATGEVCQAGDCVTMPPPEFTLATIRNRGSEQIVAGAEVDPSAGTRTPAGYRVTDVALSGDGQKVWFVLYDDIPDVTGDPTRQLWSINADGTGGARSAINSADLRGVDLTVATNRDGSVAIADSNANCCSAFLRASPGSPATLVFDTATAPGFGCSRGSLKVIDDGSGFYYSSICDQNNFYKVNLSSPTPQLVLRPNQVMGVVAGRYFGDFDIDSSGTQWLIETEAFDGATNIQYFHLVRGTGLETITRFEQLPSDFKALRDVNLTDDGAVFAYCQDPANSGDLANCYVQQSGAATRTTITDNRSSIGDMAFPDDGSRIYVNTAYQFSGSCGYFQDLSSGERIPGGSSRLGNNACPGFIANLSEDGQVLASAVTRGAYVLHDGVDGLSGFPSIDQISYRYDEEDRFLIIRVAVTAPAGLERIYLLPFFETGVDPTVTVPENQNPFYNDRSGGGVNFSTTFSEVEGSLGIWERTVSLCDSGGLCKRNFITNSYRLRIIAVDAAINRAVYQDFTPLP